MRLAARPAAELAADLAATIHPDRPNLTQRLQTPDPIGKGRATTWIWLTLGIVATMLVVALLLVLAR
jgi:hypothetical protein